MTMEPPDSGKIFLSAAEPSGDRHTAKLIRQIRRELPNMACDGIGGERMAAAGCVLLENIVLRSAMLGHAVRQVVFFYKLRSRVKIWLHENRPDLVILVDSPAWNFHIARIAKTLDIPVLYYIAPQMWAWGAWRLKKLRRLTDRIACILPFEEEWFQSRNVNATYVGHPLFDEPNPVGAAWQWPENDKKNFPTVALLPGSRQHEIEHLWPAMQKIGRIIKTEFPLVRFTAAALNDKSGRFLQENTDPDLNINIRQAGIEAVTRYADLAIVASGTATLEVAAQQCPMIVIYHVNSLQWNLVGRWLLKTPYICLVNILAGKELVPEYIPFRNQIDTVARRAIYLLNHPEELKVKQQALGELLEPIIKPGAAENVVSIIKQMLPNY